MSVRGDLSPRTVVAVREIDGKIRRLRNVKVEANRSMDTLSIGRSNLRRNSAEKREQEYKDDRQKLLDAVLESLPHELRDMIYLKLCYDIQDEPFDIVDNSTIHPNDNTYEFEPIVNAYEPPYWMIEHKVGSEFAQEAVETWYKHMQLSIHVKLLPQLLQDEDGVLYNNRAPSVRTCEFLRKLQVVVGPAPASNAYCGRPSGRAAHIRQICQSLSSLLAESGVARKKNFELHIAFRWYLANDWPSYLEVICPVVYRLKAQGFLVTSNSAYGRAIDDLCVRTGCNCGRGRWGDGNWWLSDGRDWFDCPEEECMKMIEAAKVGFSS